MVGIQPVVAFPLAAAKFILHDFVSKATGLPFDGDFGDDEDLKTLGAAANLVFEHSGELPNTYQVTEALDALASSEFIMKDICMRQWMRFGVLLTWTMRLANLSL